MHMKKNNIKSNFKSLLHESDSRIVFHPNNDFSSFFYQFDPTEHIFALISLFRLCVYEYSSVALRVIS